MRLPQFERLVTNDGFLLTSRHGRARYSQVNPNVVLVTHEGLGLTGFALPVLLQVERLLSEEGPVSLFVDAEQMASYEADFRRHWSVWLRAHRRRLKSVHFLVRTRVVETGVNLINSSIGGMIQTYRNREAFEAALARRTSGHSDLPRVVDSIHV